MGCTELERARASPGGTQSCVRRHSGFEFHTQGFGKGALGSMNLGLLQAQRANPARLHFGRYHPKMALTKSSRKGFAGALLKERALHILCINPCLTGPCIIPEPPAAPLRQEPHGWGLEQSWGHLQSSSSRQSSPEHSEGL